MGFFSKYRCNNSPFQSKPPNSDSVLLSAYPKTKSVSRKPHAPQKPFKLRLKKIKCCNMGNCLGLGELFNRYDNSKDEANRHVKHYKKIDDAVFVEKHEIIDVDVDVDDGDGDSKMRDVSDDSSIEEVDVRDGSNVYGVKNTEYDGFVVVPVYKKLQQSASKRDGKTSSLRFDIEEKEKSLEEMRSRKKGKKVKKYLVDECFTPLTEEDERLVVEAFSNRKRREVVVSHENSNIDITGEKLQCLRNGGWLNDEVINVYFVLLKEREMRAPEKFLKCHFFNTFFYKKLIGRGGYSFQSVQRWTTQKKLGYNLSECDKIFVPIHRHSHWCLAIINKKEKKIQYLDSFKGADRQLLDVLSKYYADEVKDKNGVEIDVSSWELENVFDLPEQTNGYDCGMFMVKYADFYSRDLGLCFSEENMPYFRRRTAKELLRLKAD